MIAIAIWCSKECRDDKSSRGRGGASQVSLQPNLDGIVLGNYAQSTIIQRPPETLIVESSREDKQYKGILYLFYFSSGGVIDDVDVRRKRKKGRVDGVEGLGGVRV